MGYTHYWSGKSPTHDADLDDDIRAVFEHCHEQRIELADGWGAGDPVLDESHVWFNGVADDSHETFGVDFGAITSNFCKTAHKPYDLAVVAILELLRLHSGGEFQYESDGTDAELADGRDLARRVFDANN